ncbi:MAG: PilN domain-containing protein [Chitinophagaceae bacterium]|nr:PilN domain-containing protein [Oligoflexus sp.]
MIKINLTPFEELDNPQWWVPDLVALFLVIAITFGGVFFYIDSLNQEIAAKEAEKTTIISETTALEGEVNKSDQLDGKIKTLDMRKDALKRITESKLVRYLPVILMENIQNLKPDKVWLTRLSFVDQKKDLSAPTSPPVPATPPPAIPGGTPQAPPTQDPAATAAAPAPAPIESRRDKDFPVTLQIEGEATDNVSIAEFMVALKATQNQSFEKSDLRTQLFFSDVGIDFSKISTAGGSADDKPKEHVAFKLQLQFREKSGATQEGKFSQFIDQFKRTGEASVN